MGRINGTAINNQCTQTHTPTMDEHLSQLHQQKTGSITLIGTANITHTQTHAHTILTEIQIQTTHIQRHLAAKNST